MKTLLLGAIVLLLPNLLDACGGGSSSEENSSEGVLTIFRPGFGGRILESEERLSKDVEFIEIEAFTICDEDDDHGLSWKEVSDCIVSSHVDFHGVGIGPFSKILAVKIRCKTLNR